MNHDVTVTERIEELIAEHGTLRAAARFLGADAGYLSRLSRNERDNPSDTLLAALGLVRVTTFRRISREGSSPEGRASEGPSAEGIEPGPKDAPTPSSDISAPAAPEVPAYPTGDVAGPCVCGSWPGGQCLRCARVPADARDTALGLARTALRDAVLWVQGGPKGRATRAGVRAAIEAIDAAMAAPADARDAAARDVLAERRRPAEIERLDRAAMAAPTPQEPT